MHTTQRRDGKYGNMIHKRKLYIVFHLTRNLAENEIESATFFQNSFMTSYKTSVFKVLLYITIVIFLPKLSTSHNNVSSLHRSHIKKHLPLLNRACFKHYHFSIISF